MDHVQNALQCPICMDVATIPVQKTCCDARTRPGCLRCVKKYYSNKNKVSFGGCGCNSNKYRLATDLWMVRDAVGDSKCPNDCGAIFDTTSECYKHSTGKHEIPDKNCPESYTTYEAGRMLREVQAQRRGVSRVPSRMPVLLRVRVSGVED